MSKAHQLHELLAEGSELNIVCHNNSDPDCLASALALGRIAADAGIDERHILYSGAISHQQNRAFVNLLNIDLRSFEPAALQDRPARIRCLHSSIIRFKARTTRFPRGRSWIS